MQVCLAKVLRKEINLPNFDLQNNNEKLVYNHCTI